jgi:glutamate carboxypeptidase
MMGEIEGSRYCAQLMSDAADWLGTQLPAMEAALAALVELNSFTGNREGGQRVVRLLEDVFAMPGLEAERIGSSRFADHLVFRSAGKGEPIALVGHLDTVFPPGTFEGYRVDGALRRGPGVLDMKGGLDRLGAQVDREHGGPGCDRADPPGDRL